MPHRSTSFYGLRPTAGKSPSRLRKWRCPTTAGRFDRQRRAVQAGVPHDLRTTASRGSSIPRGLRAGPFQCSSSGASLHTSGAKPATLSGKRTRPARGRTVVFWQMAGVGPMFGQASHFRNYAPNLIDDPIKVEYTTKRYDNEVNRLLGVLDRRLADRSFVAGDYSIADMAIYPWAAYAGASAGLEHLCSCRGLARPRRRPAAVRRGIMVGADLPSSSPAPGSEEQRDLREPCSGRRPRRLARPRHGRLVPLGRKHLHEHRHHHPRPYRRCGRPAVLSARLRARLIFGHCGRGPDLAR